MKLNLIRARRLRKTSTEAEQRLWSRLRAGRLNNYKFRRQYSIEPYIVDFICISQNLIIELDGGQHSQNVTYDQTRTNYFITQGYRVIRFWNNIIFTDIESILDTILYTLEKKI